MYLSILVFSRKSSAFNVVMKDTFPQKITWMFSHNILIAQ